MPSYNIAHIVGDRATISHLNDDVGRKDALRVAVQTKAEKAIVGGKLDANVLLMAMTIG